MAAKVELVPATEAHARELAQRMRKEDREEILASGGFTPLGALLDALRHSELAGTALYAGEVAAMYGCVPTPTGTLLGGRVGVAWLLTGEAVNRHPRVFLRQCRQAISEMLEHYDIIVNAIDARYTKALRWAKWLGFEVCAPEPFGLGGMPFQRIIIRRAAHV